MNLPFNTDQFLSVFSNYNTTVWPIQIIFYLIAAAALFLVFRKSINSSKVISTILGFFWLWMGIVYHALFFSSINPAAKFFAVMFVIQGIILLVFGVWKDKLEFSFEHNLRHCFGLFLVFSGTILYPIIGLFLHHTYPNNPTFGLPCPTTIFTFGMLLLAAKPPKGIFIIPMIWSIIGFSAALTLGIYEDSMLLISGLLTAVFIFTKRQSSQIQHEVNQNQPTPKQAS